MMATYMKETRLIMGMPITINIVDITATQKDIDAVFEYFAYVDDKFSTYKETSEISKINNGALSQEQYSTDMKEIFFLAEQTKKDTNGYFDITHNGHIDPSGIVKGWAIQKARELLVKKGFQNFFIDAGGDVQVSGNNEKNELWKIGIRNPFNREENVKVVSLTNQGIATSGTAIRGQHIYNPKELTMEHGQLKKKATSDIVSLTVIGPNVYDADRFATAAFAMAEKGINFIESLEGFEGYMINNKGLATYTSGFDKYVI